ncbi:MAG: hypothetical protein AAGH46_06885 [Bacteroidota bacterium]
MKSKLKTAFSILTFSLFVVMLVGSSSDEKSKGKQTIFENPDDALKYVRYRSYSTLVKQWGEPSIIDEPYLSNDNSMYEILVVWNKIRVEGQPMKIFFQNYPIVIRNNGTIQKSPGMKPLRIQVGPTKYGWR